MRAGNEKDEDQADTVGCCSLRVEHIQLFDEKDGRFIEFLYSKCVVRIRRKLSTCFVLDKDYVVVFDFPGKDSIRYYNEVPVEKQVFKNLKLFCEKKKGGDDLFDRLNVSRVFLGARRLCAWNNAKL